MKRIPSLVAGLVTLTVGCGTVTVTKVRAASPKPAECRLDVYKNEAKISKAYETVCKLQAETGTTLFADKSVAGAIEKARPEACACGADALILQDSDVEGAGFTGWGKGKATITAIRYTDGAP